MPTVRRTATVTVTEPVKGTPRRRGPGKRKQQRVEVIRVLPEVMAEAMRVKRPGERLLVVSSTMVLLVPAKPAM